MRRTCLECECALEGPFVTLWVRIEDEAYPFQLCTDCWASLPDLLSPGYRQDIEIEFQAGPLHAEAAVSSLDMPSAAEHKLS
jgi:hypothetical protein